MDRVLPRSILIPFCFRRCKPESLVAQGSEDGLIQFFERMVSGAGFVPVARFVKIYDNGAYSAEITLEESKVAVYTWPEDGDAEGIIFFCNYSGNNMPKATRLHASLREFFGPEDEDKLEPTVICRGGRLLVR
ncbi:MAG: S-adenosylmethionine decarboxylase [bacterium]|nr:S-adenosylmethionine decarboxylase [bacterium]